MNADQESPRQPKLLERVRQAIRTRHYSRETEKAYIAWTREFVSFNDSLDGWPFAHQERNPDRDSCGALHNSSRIVAARSPPARQEPKW